jgi:hypothetical protein
MAFKIDKPEPPKDWDHYLAAVGEILKTFDVTGKSTSEIICAARLAVVDTNPEVRENRRVSLRRATRRSRKERK